MFILNRWKYPIPDMYNEYNYKLENCDKDGIMIEIYANTIVNVFPLRLKNENLLKSFIEIEVYL